MSLTTSKQNISSVVTGKSTKLTEEQKKNYDSLAADLIENSLTSQCPINVSFRALDDLNGINPNQVSMVIGKQFYDPAVMRSMECMISSMAYFPAQFYGGATPGHRIKYWLQNLRKLAAGIEGTTFSGQLDGSHNIFAVKVSADESDLQHEFLIAIHLNQLRMQLPNFAYIYAGFNCSNPMTNDELAGWCWKAGEDSSSGVSTLVYEQITPSVSLTSYLKEASFGDWFNLYLQILFSLRLAHEQLDYTHYDLHTGNVLVRTLTDYEESFYIPYQTERGTEYLLVDRIATIIDYGFSHIKINSQSCDSNEPFCKADGLHFGKWGLQKYGILPNKSRPLYDAYKLLLFSAAGFDLHNNREALDFMTPLIKFFNTEDSLKNIILDEERIYYSLQENNIIDRVTLDDYLNYIRLNYDDLSYFLHKIPEDGVRIFGCNGTDICTVTPNDYSQIGFSEQLKVADLFAFYDLHQRWNNRNLGIQAKQLMESFKSTYQQLIGPQLKDLEAKLNETKFMFDKLGYLAVDSPNYSKFLMKYLKAYDLYHAINLSITVIKYAATLYNDKKTLKRIRKDSSTLTKYKQQLKDKYYTRLMNDRQKILDNLNGSEANIDLTETKLNKILSTINQVVSRAKI